ncbi:hypothetical protein CDAR_394811 [Caerostris darwini]|uniref:Uncharacterized protein n=1 Tax=Caerostris darwini TaxID=1538125 RepID=A0AAV4RNM7_9ARAC|nr:hypothetical protein CDAR_394811 [Caerostris darwini]
MQIATRNSIKSQSLHGKHRHQGPLRSTIGHFIPSYTHPFPLSKPFLTVRRTIGSVSQSPSPYKKERRHAFTIFANTVHTAIVLGCGVHENVFGEREDGASNSNRAKGCFNSPG